jgi:hypothetical protein
LTPLDSGSDSLSEALEGYITLLDQGVHPDPDEYLRRYPDCATELRSFIFDLSFLKSRIAPDSAILVDSGSPSDAVNPAPLASEMVPSPDKPGTGFSRDGGHEANAADAEQSPDLPRIKGFRLIVELGSGSQGVVYKAEQLSTRRTVALKVVRDGAFASNSDRLPKYPHVT